jgi:hypothetical protein
MFKSVIQMQLNISKFRNFNETQAMLNTGLVTILIDKIVIRKQWNISKIFI